MSDTTPPKDYWKWIAGALLSFMLLFTGSIIGKVDALNDQIQAASELARQNARDIDRNEGIIRDISRMLSDIRERQIRIESRLLGDK